MKKLISFIITICACLAVHGQTIELDDYLDDSTRVYSTSLEMCRSFTDKMVLSVGMTKFVKNSGKYYYSLQMEVSSMEHCSIPKDGRVLIRTTDDSVVELKSLSAEESKLHIDDVNGIMIKSARITGNYIVSETDLQKMFNGVKKVRMEVLPTNYEKTFKKDKVGQTLLAEYNLLKDKKFNDLTPTEQQRSNFSEGF